MQWRRLWKAPWRHDAVVLDRGSDGLLIIGHLVLGLERKRGGAKRHGLRRPVLIQTALMNAILLTEAVNHHDNVRGFSRCNMRIPAYAARR